MLIKHSLPAKNVNQYEYSYSYYTTLVLKNQFEKHFEGKPEILNHTIQIPEILLSVVEGRITFIKRLITISREKIDNQVPIIKKKL